jgi:hypothetical protein
VVYSNSNRLEGNAALTFDSETGTLSATEFVGGGSGLTGIEVLHSDLSDMPDVAGTNTDHDARYYTEAEIDTLLGNYLNKDGTTDLTGDWTISTHSITLSAGTLQAEHLYSTDDLQVADDILLGSGSVINFDSGNATITHSAGALTFNVFPVTPSEAPDADYEVANKKYVDDNYAPLASPTFTGTVTLPEVQLGETGIALDAALSGDEKWSGITIAGTLGATIGSGDLVYLNNDDGRWELVDANLSDGYDKQLGICLDAGDDGDATTILVFGKVRSAAFPAFTTGSPLYVSETAGDITHTQPTTADVAIRIVGFALTAEDLMFNPSNDYIVHT